MTQKQKEDIQKSYNIGNDKITVIPHFIEAYPKIDNTEKLNRFIFIGRLAPEKQIDHIIEAYKLFLSYGHDTKLEIYGADERDQKNHLLDLIDKYGIKNYVQIHEFTENPLNEFRKSKASLLTSKNEGFGLTIMESIEVGCPVISYDVCYGPSEIIQHGSNGYLVEKDNIEEFAKYMDKIINRPLKKLKLKQHSNKKAQNKIIKNYFRK